MGGTLEQKKRILYVITKASWGGAQRYVFDLACAMHERGHDVAVAYGTSGLLVEKLHARGIRTRELPHIRKEVPMFAAEDDAPRAKSIWESLVREVEALRSLITVLKEERPDVLHLNSSKVGGLGTLAGRLAKIPRIIFTAHGWAFNERRPWWQKGAFRILYALTIWLAHTTICVSEAVKKDMALLPLARLVVIKLGTHAPEFEKRIDARKKMGVLGEQVVLGMLAELHPTKRVDDAILALSELRSSFPHLMLIVYGEGEDRPRLAALIEKLRLSDVIHLKGFLPEAARLLPGFDIFLMPSRTEALGYAALEAGHAHLPLIASRVGGLPEIIRHKETGLLVPPENPHALARAIRLLLDEPEYATLLGKRLKDRVESQFSFDHMVRETEEIYSN